MALPASGKIVHIYPHAHGYLNGAYVTSFTDSAGVAFFGGATFKTSQINGKSAFSLSSTDYFNSNSTIDLSSTSGITACAYLKVTLAPASFGVLFEHSANYNTNNGWVIYDNPSVTLSCGAHDNTSATYNIFTTSETFATYKPIIYTHNKSLSVNEAIVRVSNAASVGSYNVNGNTTGNFGNETLYIGGRGGSSSYASFDFAIFLLYNRILNSTEIGDVETEFNTLFVPSIPKLKWTAYRLVNIPASIVASRYIDVAQDLTGVTFDDGKVLFLRYNGIGHVSAGTMAHVVETLNTYVPPTTPYVYDFFIAKRQGSTIYLRDGRTIAV
jgi:hypothetical protein